jgi:hypothetical protein
MSGLLKHGRKHVSVSQCNLFQNSIWLYVFEQIMGNRGSVGSAAHRGTAGEDGVTLGLLKPDTPLAECQEKALATYDRLTALSGDPNREKEREAVPGIVEQALNELRPYGVPSHVQHEIMWQHPDLPVPFKGYIDFMWEDHGIILDMKTQLRLSSEVSTSHARQVALYGAAVSDNFGLRVGYFTPKKCAVYQVENAKQHLESLVRIAKAIDRFLDLHDDPNELLKIVVPNPDSFYFSDPMIRQKAFEISGI